MTSTSRRTIWKWSGLAGLTLAMTLSFQNCGVLLQDHSTAYKYSDPSPLGSASDQSSTSSGSVGQAPNPPAPNSPTTNNPAYLGIKAVSFSQQNGATVDPGEFLSYLDGGDWAKYSQVDFESGARFIYLELALDKANVGGSVEVTIDSVDGPVIAHGDVNPTSGWTQFNFQSFELSQVTGVHDLFVKFNGGTGVANFKTWALAK